MANINSPENCVIGNDSAKVFEIDLQYQAGPYDYTVRVEAQGPDKWNGGSFYLAFQDATGDVYHLSIYSSKREWHEVSYNSDSPAITRIYWSDHSISADAAGANKTKAQFKVVSPAGPAK